MPRYFFHIRKGDEWIEDFEGTDLVDLPAALRDALASAREIVGGRLKHGHTTNNQIFEITDADGLILARLPFTDAYNA